MNTQCVIRGLLVLLNLCFISVQGMEVKICISNPFLFLNTVTRKKFTLSDEDAKKFNLSETLYDAHNSKVHKADNDKKKIIIAADMVNCLKDGLRSLSGLSITPRNVINASHLVFEAGCDVPLLLPSSPADVAMAVRLATYMGLESGSVLAKNLGNASVASGYLKTLLDAHVPENPNMPENPNSSLIEQTDTILSWLDPKMRELFLYDAMYRCAAWGRVDFDKPETILPWLNYPATKLFHDAHKEKSVGAILCEDLSPIWKRKGCTYTYDAVYKATGQFGKCQKIPIPKEADKKIAEGYIEQCTFHKNHSLHDIYLIPHKVVINSRGGFITPYEPGISNDETIFAHIPLLMRYKCVDAYAVSLNGAKKPLQSVDIACLKSNEAKSIVVNAANFDFSALSIKDLAAMNHVTLNVYGGRHIDNARLNQIAEAGYWRNNGHILSYYIPPFSWHRERVCRAVAWTAGTAALTYIMYRVKKVIPPSQSYERYEPSMLIDRNIHVGCIETLEQVYAANITYAKSYAVRSGFGGIGMLACLFPFASRVDRYLKTRTGPKKFEYACRVTDISDPTFVKNTPKVPKPENRRYEE